VNRRWVGLNEILKPYEQEYVAMNVSPLALTNIIHAMRDKCAHIKVGANDSLGIVGLDGPDAKIVTSLVPLLGRIVSTYLNTKNVGMTFQTNKQSA
jgi:hypothetical protein